MANVLMAPANVGTFQMNAAGMTFYKSPIINDLTGTPVDFSTWDNLDSAIQVAPGEILDGTAANGITVTGNADGTLSFQLDGNQLIALRSGNFSLVVYGVPVAGDNAQTVGTGSIAYSNIGK